MEPRKSLSDIKTNFDQYTSFEMTISYFAVVFKGKYNSKSFIAIQILRSLTKSKYSAVNKNRNNSYVYTKTNNVY